MPVTTRIALRTFFTVALAIGVAIAVFAPIVTHERAAAPPRAVASHAGSEPAGRQAEEPPSEATDPQDEQDVQGATDLYGNDVTDAVARYKLDPAGSLYEQHSPNTELPHLPPPKS